MQDGSGTSGLTYLFNTLVPDIGFLEKAKKYSKSEKVTLASKESLYYYELYRKYYDFPSNLALSKIRCPKCDYSIEEGSHFCRMCGSFPI